MDRRERVARCAGHGCNGEGWMWDSCDSGSGAQVYCDCPAGDELKVADNAKRLFGSDKAEGRSAPGGKR